MAFKYRPEDKSKLRKEINRFNAKVERLRKNEKYKGVVLPDRMNIQSVEDEIETRSDYNRTIKRIGRFFNKNSTDIVVNEKGLKLTKYEKNEFNIAKRTVNAKRSRKLKEVSALPVFAGDYPTGLTRGEVGGERINELSPKRTNIEKIRNREDFKSAMRLMEKQLLSRYEDERQQLYKKNYIKALRGELGVYAEELVPLVEQLSAYELINIYYTEQEGNIDFIYDRLSVEVRYEYIRNILVHAIKG